MMSYSSIVTLLVSCALLLSTLDGSGAFSSFSNNGNAFGQRRSRMLHSGTTTTQNNVVGRSTPSSPVLFQSSSSSSMWPTPRRPWPERRKKIDNSQGVGFSSSTNQNNMAMAYQQTSIRRRHLNTLSSNGSGSSSSSDSSTASSNYGQSSAGRGLEELKQIEADLKKKLEDIQFEKRWALESRPLNIGIVGFGRFGRFIAKTFTKYGRVVATSRSDYSDIAQGMGVKYVRLTNPEEFLSHDLDVIIFATSILSFKTTIQSFTPHIEKDLARRRLNSVNENVRGPLIVDVLSVKEHPRQILLDYLPKECDILTTHPMFGPDSGKNGWNNLNFVYEKTRINGVVLDQDDGSGDGKIKVTNDSPNDDESAHSEGMDRMERFLSIWEEEGCNMIDMSCHVHDTYASNSQFITHLMGRILGSQGLSPTPIDTSGFKSVLGLIDSTTADSFDLFYGLYKFNKNSRDTIHDLKFALDDVVDELTRKEKDEQKYERKQQDEKEKQEPKQKYIVVKDMKSLNSTKEGEEPKHNKSTRLLNMGP